jgi:DNA-nicking Smr family endonuclease
MHEIPIEDSIDLHSFLPQDIPSVVEEYLHAAHEKGFREVRLIHGRGIGVQRAAVHRLLRVHPLVEEFHDAPESHLGATVVRLHHDAREGREDHEED